MRDELLESPAPGEPFVSRALRLGIDGVDAHVVQTLHHLLSTEHLVHALSAATHEEIVDFLVEVVGIGEHTVVGRLHVEVEDGTAERAHPGEFVEVGEHHVEGLMAAP